MPSQRESRRALRVGRGHLANVARDGTRASLGYIKVLDALGARCYSRRQAYNSIRGTVACRRQRRTEMRQNRVKRIMREGGLAIVSHVGFADPAVIEIIAMAGFDGAFIDMEHT